jgi:hypothetical protein
MVGIPAIRRGGGPPLKMRFLKWLIIVILANRSGLADHRAPDRQSPIFYRAALSVLGNFAPNSVRIFVKLLT